MKIYQLKIKSITNTLINKAKKLDELLWDFDAVSLYPSAMWDEKSLYPRIDTGYAYTTDVNDELVENFNTANFTQ